MVLEARGVVGEGGDGRGVGHPRPTPLRVPGVVAVQPGQFGTHARRQEVQRPTDDDVVVETDVEGDEDGAETNPFKQRTYSPDADGALTVELAEDEFHVEEWYRPKHQHQCVGYEESTAPVTVAQIRESPHVGEVDCETDDAQEEICVRTPRLSTSFCFWPNR